MEQILINLLNLINCIKFPHVSPPKLNFYKKYVFNLI